MLTMPTDNVGTIPVTLQLTPRQIRQAYRQLLLTEHADWFEDPEVVEELLKRDRQALKEFREGKTVPWSTIKRELQA